MFTHIHRQQLKDLRNWARQQGAKQAAGLKAGKAKREELSAKLPGSARGNDASPHQAVLPKTKVPDGSALPSDLKK